MRGMKADIQRYVRGVAPPNNLEVQLKAQNWHDLMGL